MPVDTQSKEGQIIRQLIPLSTIPAGQFAEICNKIRVEVAKPNTFIFKKGDSESDLIYLIKGSVSLQSDNLRIEKINAGSESAKFALAHQIPRKIDAFAESTVHFLRVDSKLLYAHPTISYDQEEAVYMADDEYEDELEDDADDDWMTALLKSPIFSALPPTNLQQIIMSLNEVHFKKGELIIKQGEPGDYYYFIKKGSCLISRKPSANAKEIKLARLRKEDTFGEDSLLSDEPRNVSVTALTNISLIRLDKERFISLIKEPSLKFVEHSQLPEAIINGAILLDVRAPDEYQKRHLPHSANVPFFSLRVQLKSIDKRKSVVVVCGDGKASEAAAFLLLRNNIQAQIVRGGMEGVPEESIEKPAVAKYEIYDGTETSNKSEEPEEASPQSETVVEISEDADNALSIENQKLKQIIKTLQAEKEAVEKKYRVLYKQTEKLKSVLDVLKSKAE